MNLNNDNYSSIPLFDSILTNNNVLNTPKKSPSKQSISNNFLGEKSNSKSSFNTPKKSLINNLSTPKTLLKSFPNKASNTKSSSNSPQRTVSLYNNLLKEEQNEQASLKPISRSPSLKPSSPFWQQRQKVLSNTPRKTRNNSPKKKSFQSMLASINNKTSPTKSSDSLNKNLNNPTIEKRRLILDDNDNDDAFSNVAQFNILNPNLKFSSNNQLRSPSKKQKSPKKSNSSVIQKLIFDDDATDDGLIPLENTLSEQETLYDSSNPTSLASSMGPYQAPVVPSERFITREQIDDILFKHHLALKTEFSVGLSQHKFNKDIDTPFLSGRESEYNFILNFIVDKLQETNPNSKDALMIVGPPGTGKSRQLWQLLQAHYNSESKSFVQGRDSKVEITNVFSVIINCMCYSNIDGIITDLNSHLNIRDPFHNINTFEGFLKNTGVKIILVMDEFDKFINTNDSELYNFIDLAKKYSNFVLISITNSFGIGNISNDFSLEQLIFKPYESKAIESIVIEKANMVKSNLLSLLKNELDDVDTDFLKSYNLFHRNALLTLSKKFGNQNGDLRDVTNFIYQLLELRESRALMDENVFAETQKDHVNFESLKNTPFNLQKELDKIADFILNHWTMKEIVFKDVNEVFNLSSDMFNLQKLLNKMNIWQQFVLIIICKIHDAEILQHQSNADVHKDKYEYKGIDADIIFDKYKQFTLSLKGKIKSMNNTNQLKNGMKTTGSHNVLLDKEVDHSDFKKIIEFLEVSGLLNKYTHRKARTIRNFILVSYNTQDVYELLSHSVLFKDII